MHETLLTTQEEHAVTSVSVKKAKECLDDDLSHLHALNPSFSLSLPPAYAADA